MPIVEIEALGHQRFTTIKMDGREVPDVRSISLDIRPDNAVTVQMEVYATERLHFSGDALIDLQVLVMDGYVLVEHTDTDGTKTYRARRDL